jgi:hypothetical protein
MTALRGVLHESGRTNQGLYDFPGSPARRGGRDRISVDMNVSGGHTSWG